MCAIFSKGPINMSSAVKLGLAELGDALRSVLFSHFLLDFKILITPLPLQLALPVLTLESSDIPLPNYDHSRVITTRVHAAKTLSDTFLSRLGIAGSYLSQ